MSRVVMNSVFLAALVAPAAAAGAGSAPVPLEVPAVWQLEIDTELLQPIDVQLPGDSHTTTFWYLRYTVVNRQRDAKTQRPTEQLYIPDFALYTDSGELLRAGRKAPAAVFMAIKKKHNNPHLKDMVSITGKLLFGEDNGKDGVAIWPDFDKKSGKVKVFIGGLSGEQITIPLPKPVKVKKTDKDGKTTIVETDKLRLTKTLELTFTLIGDPKARKYTRSVLTRKRWVMR